MRSGHLAVSALLAGMVCIAPFSSAQTSSVAGSPAGAITLDVQVSDSSGHPVTGLLQDDFRLIDNKQVRPLAAFHESAVQNGASALPVEVVLLIDGIITPPATLSDLHRNLARYLQSAGPQLPLPMSLAFLTPGGLKTQNQPTRDPALLLANLDNNPVPQLERQGEGYLYSAELRQTSLQALVLMASKLNSRPGRKLLIWISPGWGAFEAETSEKSRKEFETLFTFSANLSTVLRQAGITLYSLDPWGASNAGISSARRYENFVKSGTSIKNVDNGDLMLQVIAAQSGGLVLYGSNNTAQLISQCIADGLSFYQISFDAPTAEKPNEYHQIEVQVNKPGDNKSGYKVRTRMRYFAGPAQPVAER